ncbi:hypothetical protein N9U41_00645 [Acidimicrobiaceae bacterium]|nr:hypothetical protein [Acidimicrobiaceae bacterium]
MNYQNLNQEISSLNFQKKYFFSIFGLYLFSLGTVILGYSVYLLLESVGIVNVSVITWNAQGLFWFLILFCVALFILFVPVEFLNVFKIYNITFKDLIINIIFVILTSLITLIFFQFLLNPSNLIVNDVVDIGKAVSFSGFIAIPLILFLQHNLKRTINFSDNFSYCMIYFSWVISSQIFL